MSGALILGPMCSGKTTELWRNLGIYASAGKKVLYVNHGTDSRCGEDDLSTHNDHLKKKSKRVTKRKLPELAALTDLDNWDVIGIDEGQFFPDLKLARLWVLKHRKVVIVASLISDINLAVFGQWYEFAPVCGVNITSLAGYCGRCVEEGRPVEKSVASYNSLRDRSAHDTSTNILIGGAETYETLCMECWLATNKM